MWMPMTAGWGPSWIWPGPTSDRRQGSARELLEEAVAQGSEHQRSEAQKLLKRLGWQALVIHAPEGSPRAALAGDLWGPAPRLARSGTFEPERV